MIAALLSALARLLGPILPFLAAWIAGKRDAAQRGKIRDLQGYKKTRERIDNAPVADNPDDALEWLRQREQR
jgi:hypothetical protein